ncbi:MAG: hypothetical protein SFY69_13205 [Planctomycetota bacterium]|nr:hypothetical protein [Planctomycetota bacterium]
MHRIMTTAAALLALGAAQACQSSRTSSTGERLPSIAVEASSREVIAGELVTFIARSRDTYGRETEIRWRSTAGDIQTDQDGRVARVKFDQPGTYSVSAVLIFDGREVERDTIEVRVRPLS